MRSTKTKLAVHMAVLLGLFAPTALLPLAPWFVALFECVSRLRIWGPAAFCAICVVGSVLPVPTVIAILATGFLFGVFVGSLVSVIGTTLGACVAFLLARIVARRWVAGKIGLSGRLAVLDRAVGEQGFKIVLLSRLSPIAPFISLNYAFGLTQVSFRQYAWGTLIGGAPGTILYVFFGAGLHSLQEVITYAQGQNHATMAHHLFFWTSLITTVVVTVWLTRVARAALRRAIPNEAPKEEEIVKR
jgi:uncharacterized membrane protein YdjX (TVP38/TMEM64 family)